MSEQDDRLAAAEAAAQERLDRLGTAMSEAAHRLGAVTMKLAIGRALRGAGYYDATRTALEVPIPDFAATVAMYESALGTIKNPTTETVQ